MITFYGYKRCGTSRKAEKFLESVSKEYNFIDLTVEPPSKDELKKIIELSGEPIKKFFNTSGVVYKSENMKDKVKDMSDEEKLETLASNGKLIKRPIVTDGKSASVGFKEEIFSGIWK